MSGEDDYCELCDLPRSTCIHGMPEPEVVPDPPKAPRQTRQTRQARQTRARTASAPKARPAASAVTTREAARPRRWSAPADFVPHIVAMLEEAGEGLLSDDALSRLEERVADSLRPGDRERSPQGEQRWRTAARKARRELVTAGVLSDARPGVWELNRS